jgi:predicted kinase
MENKPKIILLNGNPGLGKSTLAQRYIDDHPMALNLDIDIIWRMMGGWRTEPRADIQKLKYAYYMAEMHLSGGDDVIVPQAIQDNEQYCRYEEIAAKSGAILKEVVLIAPLDEAIERFKVRGRADGHPDGIRPGGIIDTGGREAKLAEMYNNVLTTIAQRPNTVLIESHEHDVDGTYQLLLGAVN